MSTGSLNFPPLARLDELEQKLRKKVANAIAAMGLDTAAGACGLKDSQLSDMVAGRGGRRMSTDIAAVIAERIGPGRYRDDIVAVVREMFALFQPESDGLYAHRLEGALLRFGEPGAEMLAQCRREARR